MEKHSARVAVTSRSFSKHPVLRAELEERFSNITFNDEGRSLSGDQLIAFLKGHERAITALEPLDDRLFKALPELKIVSKYGVGLDMIDLDAMQRRGVLLGWTPGVNRRSVAELVIAFAVDLLHRTGEAEADVRQGRWKQVIGRQLTGKTVGIIGCGNIGKDVALLLRAFDCVVLANDILSFPDFYRRHSIQPVGLEDLLRRADVVTLHVPLDASTRGMLSAERLSLMKRGAVLINTARGGLVDEQAMKTMVRSGHLGGVAFDVFASEPPDDPELLSLPNVLATPHIGGSTQEAILAMGRAAIEGLLSARSVTEIRPAVRGAS